MFGRAAFVMEEAVTGGRDTRRRNEERKWRSPFFSPSLSRRVAERRGDPSNVSQGLNRCTSASRKRAPRLYNRFPFWSISSLLLQPRVPKLPPTIEIIDSSSITLGESRLFSFPFIFRWSVECRCEKKFMRFFMTRFFHVYRSAFSKIVHLAFWCLL